MTVGRKIGLGYAVAVLFLAVIGWIAFWNTSELIVLRTQRTHSYNILSALDALKILLLDAETGQRGYLLTGEERYLEPFHSATVEIESIQKRLGELAQDIPSQERRTEALKPLVSEKLGELNDTIRLRKDKDKGFELALQEVKTDKGKKSMDEIRRILGDMNQEERNTLKLREDQTNSRAQSTYESILIGTGLSLAVLSLLGFWITRGITRPVTELVNSLTSSSAELLAGTSQQASGSQEQASAVTETVSTVDEVLKTSDQSAQRARAVSDSAQKAAESGKAGQRAVEETVVAMADVREQVESIAENILALAEQAQAIGEITATVNDIAEQTNLLALNAAIEASRAGEQGRGFSVVAAEIKTLADQSKKATAQVRQILGEIQKATNSAVMVTEEGTKSVGVATRSATQAGETIKTLAQTLGDAAQAAAQIAASASQQATGMAQIHQAMKNIHQVTGQNLASTRQAERAANDLNALGGRLKTLISGNGA
ncbi:MAG TPA: methyl-accepting chemotaxis protein [Planctomycetota bacterium]|nr:methyl-accepting chemotaxis protein [Planctomycetota bacterium]